MAQPPKWKSVNRTEVEALAGLGCKGAEIAAYYGLSTRCVRKMFARELSRGRARGRIQMRQLLRKEAEAGKMPALLWQAKQLPQAGVRPAAGTASALEAPGDAAARSEQDARLRRGLAQCLADPEAREALLVVAEKLAAAAQTETQKELENPQTGEELHPQISQITQIRRKPSQEFCTSESVKSAQSVDNSASADCSGSVDATAQES